jgi:hypothetical protein
VQRTLVGLVALLACSGCVVVTYGRYSRAALEDPEALGVTHGPVTWYGERDGDTFQLRGAHLQLEPLNARAVLSVWGLLVPLLPLPGFGNPSQSYAEQVSHAPAFLLTLRLRASRDGVSLDPGQVALRRADGSLARPRGYWGLDSGGSCRGFVRAPQQVPPKTPSGAALAIPPRELACVTWLFELDAPDPAEPFALELGGLQTASGPLLHEPVRFEPGSSWTLAFPTF